MQSALQYRLSTLLLIITLVVAGFALLDSPVALADMVLCRTDPFILLSNGTVVDISADVGALLTEVQEVRYVLHIPAGLRVIAAVSTPNWPTTIEHFEVYANNPPNTFSTTTTVYTVQPNTPVTANMLVNLTYRSLSGVSGDNLSITIKK